MEIIKNKLTNEHWVQQNETEFYRLKDITEIRFMGHETEKLSNGHETKRAKFEIHHNSRVDKILMEFDMLFSLSELGFVVKTEQCAMCKKEIDLDEYNHKMIEVNNNKKYYCNSCFKNAGGDEYIDF